MKEEEFERLAKTSRLKLSEEEKTKIKKDIEEVISQFDKISGIKSDAEPAHQPIEVPTRLREDKVIPFDNVEGLKKASKLHDGYILGPKL